MVTADGAAFETPTGRGFRFEFGPWPEPMQATEFPADAASDIPDWARRNAPTVERPPITLAPSALGGAKALGADLDQDRNEAMNRGTALHLLLGHLSDLDQRDWAATGKLLVGDRSDFDMLLDEASIVLAEPSLGRVFVANAMREVDLTSSVPSLDGRRIRGTVDRLIVSEDQVLAVDFKSNTTVPGQPKDVPAGYLRQMGAYLEALEQIYPDHAVEVAILWTKTAALMSLPHDIVKAELRRTSLP